MALSALSSAGINSSLTWPHAEQRNTGMGTYESFGAPVRRRETLRITTASVKVVFLHSSHSTAVVSLRVTDLGWGVLKSSDLVMK